MAAAPMTYQCVVYPKDHSIAPYPATLVGFAFATGLSVGGGPMPGGQPGEPTHPIELPPTDPAPPETPLDQMLTAVAKEPPAEGGWGWFPEYGWMYKPPAGSAGPRR